MPGLREQLRDSIPQLRLPGPASPVHLPRVAADIERRFGGVDIDQPAPDRRIEVYRKLLHLAEQAGPGIQALSTAELKITPWVLFTREPSAPELEPLAERWDLLSAYLREIHRRGRAGPITGLIFCFLLFYPRGLRHFDRLRSQLATEMLPRASGPRAERWRRCIDDCGLLEADASTRLAARWYRGSTAPQAAMAQCCLAGLLTGSPLVEAAFVRLIALLRRDLTQGTATPAQTQALLDFALAPDRDHALRFGAQRVALADGLLLPFREGSPPASVATPIKTFLLTVIGDPRLPGADWSRIDPQARQVMLGWMVSDTLADFFRLLEHAAQTAPDARRMLRPRIEFWTRYLRAGVIDHAWVALGPVAQAQAFQLLGSGKQHYAELHTTGDSRHSAIILSIGNLTVTEWSHNGPVRIWLPSKDDAPKLYQPLYFASDLRGKANMSRAHLGNWQKDVKDWIYRHSGIDP
jgi:hypothetical protein